MVVTETSPPTASEYMIAAAAREIRDCELVFVGMRLPLLAFMLAKKTHAPDAVGLFENGVIRAEAATELLYTMSDPPNIAGATRTGDMLEVMGLLQSGRVALGFVGAAEVDRFGNLNTTRRRSCRAATSDTRTGDMLEVMGLLQSGRVALGFVGAAEVDRFGNLNTTRVEGVRLPGSGGASDIASLAARLVVVLNHKKSRLVPRVHYVTSPGYGDGGDWRERVGLAGGGPSAVITDRGVMRFGEDTHEAELRAFHVASSPADVVAETGWPLRVSPDVAPTRPPSAEDLAILRSIDPERVWLGTS